MRNSFLIIIILLAFSLLGAIPEGFHTFDEVINITREGISSGKSDDFLRLFSGQQQFEVMVDTALEHLSQLDVVKNLSEEEQAQKLEAARIEMMSGSAEHDKLLAEQDFPLKLNVKNLHQDYFGVMFQNITHYYTDYGHRIEQFGIHVLENPRLVYTDGSYIIECTYPSLLEIDGGYVVEMAPTFKVYRNGFSLDEIASILAEGFTWSEEKNIDTLYVTEIEMQKQVDYFIDNFKSTDQFKGLEADSQQMVLEELEKSRGDLDSEIYTNNEKTVDDFFALATDYVYFDYKEFSVDSVVEGNVSTEFGVTSMQGLNIKISNEDYSVTMTFGELMKFPGGWKLIGAIDFDIQEK